MGIVGCYWDTDIAKRRGMGTDEVIRCLVYQPDYERSMGYHCSLVILLVALYQQHLIASLCNG